MSNIRDKLCTNNEHNITENSKTRVDLEKARRLSYFQTILGKLDTIPLPIFPQFKPLPAQSIATQLTGGDRPLNLTFEQYYPNHDKMSAKTLRLLKHAYDKELSFRELTRSTPISDDIETEVCGEYKKWERHRQRVNKIQCLEREEDDCDKSCLTAQQLSDRRKEVAATLSSSFYYSSQKIVRHKSNSFVKLLPHLTTQWLATLAGADPNSSRIPTKLADNQRIAYKTEMCANRKRKWITSNEEESHGKRKRNKNENEPPVDQSASPIDLNRYPHKKHSCKRFKRGITLPKRDEKVTKEILKEAFKSYQLSRCERVTQRMLLRLPFKDDPNACLIDMNEVTNY